MITDRKTAKALSGKTARACESCLKKRARWFCAADDAFLCQACDDSVHSANQLASRHERIRLETASCKITGSNNTVHSAPTWHQGFTRKARTPRNNKVHQHVKDEEKVLFLNNPLPFVPEIGNEDDGISNFLDDDNDLLCRVPVFDPFAAELCADDMIINNEVIKNGNQDGNILLDNDLENLPEFLSSDMDLAEFAADVENLLGLEEANSHDSKDSSLLDCKQEVESFDDDEKVIIKIKDEVEVEAIITDCDRLDQDFDLTNESSDWSFNYESPTITLDELEEEKCVIPVSVDGEQKKDLKRSSSFLRLNYEAVIDAWASQGSPWTSGIRPEFNPDDCWPDCMGTCPKNGHHNHPYGLMRGNKTTNGAREARVMRYKEKRRTRLFSKKIRYEVRKLNAEKRPRMKGRFVKRTSSMGNSFPAYIINTN